MSNYEVETRRVPDATALYVDGRLVATAMYSNAGGRWNMTDERTADHLGAHEDRTTAEYHLELMAEPYRQDTEGRAR